jgi:hypothetical protein
MGQQHLLLQRVQRPLHSRTQLDGFGGATGSDMWGFVLQYPRIRGVWNSGILEGKDGALTHSLRKGGMDAG